MGRTKQCDWNESEQEKKKNNENDGEQFRVAGYVLLLFIDGCEGRRGRGACRVAHDNNNEKCDGPNATTVFNFSSQLFVRAMNNQFRFYMTCDFTGFGTGRKQMHSSARHKRNDEY